MSGIRKYDNCYKLRLRLCDDCEEFYKGSKYSSYCPKCRQIRKDNGKEKSKWTIQLKRELRLNAIANAT